MSTQLYPEVIDATTLGPVFSAPKYLTIAVEGQAAASGASAVLDQLYDVTTPAQAEGLFGVVSPLTSLVKFVLKRGIDSVKATASIKSATLPTQAQRQTAWDVIAANPDIRIVLTDSVLNAEHVALADSMEAAELAQNKMFAVVGMAAATSSSGLTTAATAIASKRGVLVGPAIYDENGAIQPGSYAAAAVAAAVALNPDISDDLDGAPLPGLTGVELDATGNPLFRKRFVTNVMTNDLEVLLQGGVSPLQKNASGGVSISHLRTTYMTDTTFDALMTRLIQDQLFLDVKNYCLDNKYLRAGNTAVTRARIKAGVEALLQERSNWVQPINQPDGQIGYGVSVISSANEKEVIVGYTGKVVRGIQVIKVDAKLTIAA